MGETVRGNIIIYPKEQKPESAKSRWTKRIVVAIIFTLLKLACSKDHTLRRHTSLDTIQGSSITQVASFQKQAKKKKKNIVVDSSTQNSDQLCSIPTEKNGSDFFRFRRSMQFAGWINKNSFARCNESLNRFSIITPYFVGEWAAVSFFHQDDQSMICAVEYALYENKSTTAALPKLVSFPLMIAGCPPEPYTLERVKNNAHWRNENFMDEFGILRPGKLYTWGPDDWAGPKITLLKVFVFESNERYGMIAFWMDDNIRVH